MGIFLRKCARHRVWMIQQELINAIFFGLNDVMHNALHVKCYSEVESRQLSIKPCKFLWRLDLWHHDIYIGETIIYHICVHCIPRENCCCSCSSLTVIKRAKFPCWYIRWQMFCTACAIIRSSSITYGCLCPGDDKGARASATMVMTMLNRINSDPTL